MFDHSRLKDMARKQRSESAFVLPAVGPKRQEKTEILGENFGPVPLCSPQIPQKKS